MSGGYRTQLAIGNLSINEIPLEGEPRWDPINRKLGFWNFEHNEINWFRIPGHNDNDNYVPAHTWEGTSLKFKNPDGSWGEEVNLLGNAITDIGITPSEDFGYTFTFTITDAEGSNEEIAVGTGPLPDNSPEYLVIATDADEDITGKTKFVKHTGTLTEDRTLIFDDVSKPGSNIRVTRTGTGAFVLSVNGLVDLEPGTWADATFDGEAWYLSATGSLTL